MEAKEEIVISGLSGRYPECGNVEELKEALLKGLDLITDDERRFPRGVMGIPPRAGKLPDMDKFDATFFVFHAKQAEFMDPRQRILCETSYECIVDAGFNPQELRGSNTGVYVGMTMFTNPDGVRECEGTNGYANIGLSSAMAANRISYCFDFKGKSYSLDTACSSGLNAFVNAVQDIRSGKVDAALICAANLLLHPHESFEFNKLHVLSKDGKCKAFSTLRDGYVRSEAAVSLLVQKKSISRRVYATVVGAGNNSDGYKVEGITYPSSEMQLKLMQQIYTQQDVNPDEIAYIEAHGSGTPIGDTQELKAITTMFCNNRKDPLLVGSVKSNMGHPEITSGLCSISKVLIAMETGVIPANLHVDSLDTDLPGIKDGKLKVVTENLPWDGGIAAVNNFGFGGANAHVALKSNPKEKMRTLNRPRCRLVQVSGRTEEAVNYFLDEIEKNHDDEDFLALVDEVHKIDCEGHNFRGYAILGEKTQREVSIYCRRRPIWFIYTGMGAQWLGMGRDLMTNEIFRMTIERCAAALKPYNVNLVEILTSPEPNTFDESTNCFSAIAAVEIAMTDLLYSLGIVPDGITGHSLGEVACSYADGQVTPEEAVLLAYARGYSSKCVQLPAGAMAAVGLSKEQCLKLLPHDIYIACQNGKNNVTISGPTTSISSFIDELSTQGVFVRKVNTGGLAYHSKYVKDAGPHLYDFIKKVLTTPPLRSAKWVSTSLAENQKNEHWGRYNCAEYHTNNFCGPVLFDGVYKHIPENAIVLEVAPHGLMQSILKRELDPSVMVLSMANRNSPDNEEWFLSSIGKIYLAGGQPNLKSLYKSVTYPVSRGTKMLSPLIKWDHSTSWLVPIWTHKDHFGQTIRVNISSDQHAFLAGHNIDGKVLMPATGYLDLAWRTLARLHLKNVKNFPVTIENIKFIRVTVLPPNTDMQFIVNIMKTSGNFEIFEGGSLVCTGIIYTKEDVSSEYRNAKCPEVEMDQYLSLTSEDVYKECHLRGYLYEGVFQGIKVCDVHALCGRICWKGNFLSFLDSMIHMRILSVTKRDLLLLTAIERVVIDPQEHLKQVTEDADLPIFFNQHVNVIRSGGIEISGPDLSQVPRRKQIREDPVLETYEFLPYDTSSSGDDLAKCPDVDTWLSVAVQIMIQNKQGLLKTLKICQLSENDSNKLIIKIKKIIDLQPMVEAEYIRYDKNDETAIFDVIVLTESLLEEAEVETIKKRLGESGMVLLQGDINKLIVEDYNIVYKAVAGKDGIYLLRPNSRMSSKYSVVHVTLYEYDWLEKLRILIQNHSKDVVYLVSQGEAVSGLVGLMKCLLAEPSSLNFKCILIQDSNVTTFSVDNDFYRIQIEKNMTFNVLRKNQWGTYVHLPLKPTGTKEVDDATVSVLTVGDLSTLKWIENSSAYIKHHPNSERVYVHYSSMNFRDMMVATANLQLDQSNEPIIPQVNIGLEYSGVTDTGKRVMGILPYESLSLQVQTDPSFTWEIPTGWTLDEAATVPCVYTTCYYAMLIRGQLQRGESVLIHAGTEGIGLSAISIALSMGCTVFTTVGSQEKREYLKKIYPQLPNDNISSSRNSSFRNMIMEKTEGRGVNVILNSLGGKLFKDSLMCVAKHGRFLEIGKVDCFNRTLIDYKMLLKNTSFHGIVVEELFYIENVKKEIHDLLTQGIRNGVVKPLPRTIFKEQQVEDAFRYLLSEKHKGKVLIELRKEEPAGIKPPIRTINAIPKVFFDPNKSYILIGGLGGVGLELADWLIKRGATKIILNSRRPVYSGYQSYCLRKWSMWKGITARINTDDTMTLEGAKNLVHFAKRLGPVGGIFNTALVLKDALIENQTSKTYEAVFGPKIVSGENMDILSRTECPELDHFIVFSSVTCGRGNSGQTNYGMANSALEQLCEKRKAKNLPALAVQWGVIGDVGALAKTKIINKLDARMEAQNINSCLETLEKFMVQDSVVGSSMVLASKSNSTVKDTRKTLAQVVAHILGIRNLSVINKTLTLTQLGMDSLMVVEIKQILYQNRELELNPYEIRELTFNQLMAISEANHKNTDIALDNPRSPEVYGKGDEILCEEPIIKMKQKEMYLRTVFMIHAIEGHVEELRSIASQLQAEVYGLQCTKESNYDSVEEYADYYFKHIRAKQPKGPYLLCAYSFDTAIAFEMGLKLERDGESAQIVMLDGSPAYIRGTMAASYVNQENLQEETKTRHLVTLVSSLLHKDRDKITKLLATTEGWEKQLQLARHLVSKERGLNAEYFAVYVEMYFKRCLAGFKYKPKGLFQGKVLLIRAEANQVLSSEDYDLQKICQQEVEVVKLKGGHNTVVLGENSIIVSKKINAMLR